MCSLTGSKSGMLKGAVFSDKKNSSGVQNLTPILIANWQREKKNGEYFFKLIEKKKGTKPVSEG